MKTKILSLLLFGVAAFSNSQCLITAVTPGSVIRVGQPVSFSIPSTLGQCTDCYDWDINGNNMISGSDQKNTVTIIPTSRANFTLSVTYFDETGCHSCSFTPPNLPLPAYPLPNANCFGFDPVIINNSSNITSEGTLNYAYIGGPNQNSYSSTGLTFTWYFKLLNGTLLTFNEQNPSFRQLCPNTPNGIGNLNNSTVMSFACNVSNGVETREYRSIVPGWPISGISFINNTQTCFTHQNCIQKSLNPNSQQILKIKVFPNPASSIINFEGIDLEKYSVTIFDVNGVNIIENSKIDKPINIENQKKGVLFYKISNENEVIQQGKLIKQ